MSHILFLPVFLGILFSSTTGFSLCLKDCEGGGDKKMDVSESQKPSSSMKIQQEKNRQQSHNVGSVKNAVMGNMNVRIGHEQVHIGGLQNSDNNFIDTSIHSTIILGDMKQ